MHTLERSVRVLSLSQPTASGADIARIRGIRHTDPHSVLGAHEIADGVVVRAYDPTADRAWCIIEGTDQHVDMTNFGDGFFEAAFASDEASLPIRYRLRFQSAEGGMWESEDPYAFMPTLGDIDLHLFGEGNHHKLYHILGAHVREMDGVRGVGFAVWAPNADRVSVTGSFNMWDGRRHAMRRIGGSGVWELFIPRLAPGELYKFEVRTRGGNLLEKIDPLGFGFELRPSTAAIVTELDGFEWHDQPYMERRNHVPLDGPMNVYEVHLGSWMTDPGNPHGFMNYAEIAQRLADYVVDMGYTHVELLPVAEHPYDGSWGYQVTGYYAPTSRYGTPKEFMAFVDHLHQRGIGVIVDWVPAHFPRDIWALGRFDGTALYEHEDPRQGEHLDWGTYIFNFGRNEVRNFLAANALFWLDTYHIDGLRVDAVASMIYLDYSRKAGEWIPNKYGGRENLEALDFLKQTNVLVKEYHPGAMTIAEESTSWPMVSRPVYLGGLGFDFKWNMGWMNDFLTYLAKDPIHRKYHHNNLTFAMMYAYTENFVLVLSHDEVVHGKRSLLDKMPGDLWQKFANLRCALGYMMAHPGKKLMFQGAEVGQWQEWYERDGVHFHLLEHEPHRKLHEYVRTLNHLYKEMPALHQVDYSWEGFQWIDCHDWEDSVLSFLRKGKDPDDFLVIVANFTPMVRQSYHFGVPREGFYQELLNSDAEAFYGSNVGNLGGVWADENPSHGFEHSITITLPPLSVLYLRPDRATWRPRKADGAPADEGS